jgi:WD40 repeat protein
MSIITAFSDGSIFVWYLDTFSLQWKLTLEQMTGPLMKEEQLLNEKLLSVTRPSYFACSSDGEIVAYGGLSYTLYVWNVIEKRLMHEIVIPSFEHQWITQIEFLGSSKIVALLSNEGDLIFVETVLASFMGQLQGQHKVDIPALMISFIGFRLPLMEQLFRLFLIQNM